MTGDSPRVPRPGLSTRPRGGVGRGEGAYPSPTTPTLGRACAQRMGLQPKVSATQTLGSESWCMCWSWSLEGKHLEGSFINLFLKVYLYEFLLGTSFNIKVIYINSYKHYFASKGPSSHSHSLAMVFPVVMYGCESWTVKKAERGRIDAFELWCWRRLLRVPWTARRSNQSILKEISPEYSLEGLMLKLKLQYFGHLM